MELKGSKTEQNLMTAFAGESQARNKYTYYASKAKKDGFEQIAAIFEETANNEKEHAKLWFKELHGGNIPSTEENLEDAANGENYEWTEMYKEFAKVAKEEGFSDIENLFTNIASIENVHSERFKKYAEKLSSGSLFKDTITSAWMCTNCGFIYEGLVAPAKCPVCSHPQGYFIKFDESPFEDK